MFKLVQQAYDQIVEERERGTAGSTSGAWGSYGGYGYSYAGSSSAQDPKMQAVLNYLNSRHYTEALHVLEDIPERNAAWYYFHAIANAGIGNNINATEDAKRAASMEPDNLRYQQLYRQLSEGREYGIRVEHRDMESGQGLCTLCMACMVMNLCCCGPYGGVLCC